MSLHGVQPGDTVTCCVKGRQFVATVRLVGEGWVRVDPPAGITYYHVKARQVLKRHRR